MSYEVIVRLFISKDGVQENIREKQESIRVSAVLSHLLSLVCYSEFSLISTNSLLRSINFSWSLFVDIIDNFFLKSSIIFRHCPTDVAISKAKFINPAVSAFALIISV